MPRFSKRKNADRNGRGSVKVFDKMVHFMRMIWIVNALCSERVRFDRGFMGRRKYN